MSDENSKAENTARRDRTFLLTVFLAFIVSGLMLSTKPSVPASDSGSAALESEATELPDFSKIKNVKDKKRTFFSFLLPKVERINNAITKQRRELHDIALVVEKNKPLSDQQQGTLDDLAVDYKVDRSADTEAKIRVLQRRIDIIPVSLVLSQSATESAWGTSRFARNGNNLFGIWCFSRGCGIVPNARMAGASHEVATYETPEDALKRYVEMLNTHPAYREFRDLRESLRHDDETLLGYDLAEGLLQYSERREEYVKDLRQMIRTNKLARYDQPDSVAAE